MTESIKALNALPISQHCRRQLKVWGEFPQPDRLHPIQLLEAALERCQVREDLEPEVLFLLRIAPKNPQEIVARLSLQNPQLHQIPPTANPVGHLLEIVESVASEGQLPENFL